MDVGRNGERGTTLGRASRIAFHCSSQRRLPMSVHTQGLAAHTVPKTMRAAAIDRSGGPEALSIHSLPVPELARC
jgi:hypothetical protein